MKHKVILIVVFLVIGVLVGNAQDFNKDMSLWYNINPQLTNSSNKWMEYALPIGNGRLGAALVNSVQTDDIQINEKTFWEGTPMDMGSDFGRYLNLGHIYVKDLNALTDKDAKNYIRFLDLSKAVEGVNYSGGGTDFKRIYFVSYPQNVIVAYYTSTKPMNVLVSLSMGENTYNNGVAYKGADGFASGKLKTIYYNCRFRVVAENGIIKQNKNGIEVSNSTNFMVLISAATSFDSKAVTRTSGEVKDVQKKVEQTLTKAAKLSYNTLLNNHLQHFTSLMGRVKLNLTSTIAHIPTNELIDIYNTNKVTDDQQRFLEQLYFNYSRYLAISSSYPWGRLNVPSNLQGIWCNSAHAPWHSDIHTNINVQMNYWIVEQGNLSECHLPFLNWIIDNAASANWKKAGQRGAKEGWTVFTESNIFGGMSTWGDNYYVANAWLAFHLWQHYIYTLDKKYLHRAFPAMWCSAKFWMDRMILDRVVKDGKYVCPDEYSPEQNDHPKEDGVAHAQQLVINNLRNCKKAIDIIGAKQLGLTEQDVNTLNNFIAKTDCGLAIETYNGQWGEWAIKNGVKVGDPILREWKYTPFFISKDKGHRHLSHLMCLYPLSQVTKGDKYFNAVVNSLKLRGDEATGWSMGWKVNLWARALDGNHAHKIIQNALKHSTSYDINQYKGGVYYNLFDSHAPFQIDGNFGVGAGMAQMLMQSETGIISILPSLPDVWKNGSVYGLKATYGFVVDIEWKNNKATRVKVNSLLGQPLIVNGLNGYKYKILNNKGKEVNCGVVQDNKAIQGVDKNYWVVFTI